MMIAVAALRIEPAALRERLEKSGFTAAVFADEKSDLARKGQLIPRENAAMLNGYFAGSNRSGRLTTLRRKGAPMRTGVDASLLRFIASTMPRRPRQVQPLLDAVPLRLVRHTARGCT
jgi:hypothetical protein